MKKIIKVEKGSEFQEHVLDYYGKALVSFYNSSGSCKDILRTFEIILDELNISNIDNINLVIVNVQTLENIARDFNVMYVPSVLIFDNGKLKDSVIGVVTKTEILTRLKNVQ
jgi:thioredoxin 1